VHSDPDILGARLCFVAHAFDTVAVSITSKAAKTWTSFFAVPVRETRPSDRGARPRARYAAGWCAFFLTSNCR